MNRPTLVEIKGALRRAHIEATKGCNAARAGLFRHRCAPEDKATCEACKELSR